MNLFYIKLIPAASTACYFSVDRNSVYGNFLIGITRLVNSER